MANAYPAAVRRILIVDDNELNRTLTSAVLTHATYDVDSVADGAAALRAVAIKSYDLVLLDLDMPNLAGHAAAAAMRRSSATPPKLVVLSARSSAVDRELSADIGMDGHIARPITPDDLVYEVAKVLQPARVAPHPGMGPETWNRTTYLDLANHLGHDRLEATLAPLLAQCEGLLGVLVDRHRIEETVSREAHDLASVAGMLGFEAVSRRCLDVLAAATSASVCEMLPRLEAILRRTIAVLKRHVASVQTSIAA